MTDYTRLLFCHDCQTIDELPDTDRPPEYDDVLLARVAQHQYDDRHGHNLELGRIETSQWDKPEVKAKVARDAHPAGESAGLGSAFYDLKNTFTDDAMTCWKAHNRTRDCPEWRSDAKKLLPDTGAERRAEGLDPKTRPNTWLCDFCPVTSIYSQRRNETRGDYA